MSQEDQTQTITIQRIIQLIDGNKSTPAFRLAQLIYKEVIEGLLEDERQIWMALAYAKKPFKNNSH